MKKITLIGLTAFMAFGTGFAQNQDSVQQQIAEAREVIEQYVDTRQAIARVKNEWKSYQELTERRISLYEREINKLQEQIEQAEEQTTQAEREISRIQDEIAQLRAANDIVTQALKPLENKLRELFAYFPKPLKDRTERLAKQLGKSNKATDGMAIVIGILNEADKFNSEFNIDTDEKVINGQTLVVDVIYIGLAQAFYVNKDGTIAGHGVPGNGEWQWTQRNELAPAVRNAVQYYTGDIKPALLVDLPIDIASIQVGN